MKAMRAVGRVVLAYCLVVAIIVPIAVIISYWLGKVPWHLQVWFVAAMFVFEYAVVVFLMISTRSGSRWKEKVQRSRPLSTFVVGGLLGMTLAVMEKLQAGWPYWIAPVLVIPTAAFVVYIGLMAWLVIRNNRKDKTQRVGC